MRRQRASSLADRVGAHGHVWPRIEPVNDVEFEFVDEIVGGVVPKEYIGAVEKGAKDQLANGVLGLSPQESARDIVRWFLSRC